MTSNGLVVGVDTHLDMHVAVVLDRLGRRLAVREFSATDTGNAAMAGWLDRLGRVTDAGVEGTGSYGYRLARQLAANGITVREINCPDRSRRRRRGKSDPVDAEAAARAVLAGEATAIPKDRGGFTGELRLLLLTRRSAVKARTQASNQIKAFLRDAEDEVRARLRPLRQRLTLATTMLGDPGVLLLDEPLNGLDPDGIRWMRDLLRRLADDGRTVLISSHLLAEAAQTVDDVVVIAAGRLAAEGPIATLTASHHTDNLEELFFDLINDRSLEVR